VPCYELVEQGLASPSDRHFADRLTHHRQRIAALSTDIASLERFAREWRTQEDSNL
jgi:hypothetical protein